jgi:hypothetical protein
MPSTGTCCSGGLSYCPNFGTCESSGFCCARGDDCDSNGSGSGSGGATPTYHSTSPTTSIDLNDIFTYTPSPHPPLPTRGLAGGHPKADGRIAAGCVVAAALLI